jgi:hypothetical protein
MWITERLNGDVQMPTMMQFRTYTIREGRLDDWLRRWREQVVPLRREFGFEIDGAWVDRERGLFFWTITHSGPGTFEEANDRFWASPERRALGIDTDEYVLDWDMRTVERIY